MDNSRKQQARGSQRVTYTSFGNSIREEGVAANISRSQTAFENVDLREYHTVQRQQGDGFDFNYDENMSGIPRDPKIRAAFDGAPTVVSPTPVHYSTITQMDVNYSEKPPSRTPSRNQQSASPNHVPSRPSSRKQQSDMASAMASLSLRSKPAVPELPLHALEDTDLDRNSPLSSAHACLPSSLFSPTTSQRPVLEPAPAAYAYPGMIVVDPMSGQQYVVPLEEPVLDSIQLGSYSAARLVQPVPQPVLDTKKKNSAKKDPKPIVRSAFLEHIIESPETVVLSDILGHGLECCCDQYGSRRVQELLMTCQPNDRRRLVNELLPDIISLMNDVFANYVVQKLLDRGEVDEINAIVSAIHGRVVQMSFGTYSCRVVQKALDVVPVGTKAELADEIRGCVMKCVTDQNANHVVQKILEVLDPQTVSFIVDDLKLHVYELAFHPFGCHVMQRVLDKALPHVMDTILAELERGSQGLMQDQYGNYVIQHLVSKGHDQYRSRLIHRMKGQVVALSQHKYASNVVEKCFINGTLAQQNFLLEDILEGNAVVTMSRDQYANYVLQKLLEVLEHSSRDRLVMALRGHMHIIRNYPHGRHIIQKMMKMGLL